MGKRVFPGVSTEDGVRVERFPVARPRDLKAFADLSDEVFDDLGSSPEREQAWFQANGPDAPALLEHLRAHGTEYDIVVFWAFRYAPQLLRAAARGRPRRAGADS